MKPLHAARKVAVILGSAALFAILVCLLPENPYQRWQLLDGTIYDTLRWDYERIAFDARPIDVAIVGDSQAQLGLNAPYIQQRLSALGWPAQVANFGIVGAGRNIEWAILDEAYRHKSPRIMVVTIDATEYGFGHPAFKYIAPTEAVALPPAPLLHNYFYDLAYLPFRHLKLFGAWLLPDQFGLPKTFDLNAYMQKPTDFTTSRRLADGKWLDMDHVMPKDQLLEQARINEIDRDTLSSRALRLVNEGDDHTYVREIAKLAREHGAKLMFLFLPNYNAGSHGIADRAFLEQYGTVLSFDDLSQQDRLYMDWGHLNHAGALVASDRLAAALVASAPKDQQNR